MKNALSLIRDSNLLKMVIAVVVGVLFVVGGVSAATTISTNIDTAGTLNADGATTLNGAVTLGNAVGDDIVITGNATSSKHFANRFTSNTFAAGGTATTTINSAGNVSVAGTLAATGATTLSSTLAVTGVTTLSASTTVGTATLFAGDDLNRVGAGTTTPLDLLHVEHQTASSTIVISSGGAAGIGGRIIFEDSDGAGCSEIYVLNGTLTTATVTCPVGI